MNSPTPDAKSVFGRAAEIPSPASRAAFLDNACAGHPAVRAEVETLLKALGNAGAFMAAPAAPAGETASYDTPISEGEGTVIGPYTLREQIGEGGMGLVFVAEQTHPVRRKVALKVIKPGMDTRQVVARFEAERQALALMDHPHIARVLDAGTTDAGRPYFVMELVKGVPITEYADANNLTPKARLELFVQVCNAVQHAHQKGVIHRDLKPSNILVAPHDGVPVVKVIDFGVAKALGQSLTEKTIYTRFAQMIGTPLYMSPEQAEVNQLDADTRSDVYSLGVVLYELLTGTTPFDGDRFRKAAFDEIRRIIKEEEPPRPSTRLTSLGATLTAVSAKRGTDPGRLAGLVRGELDWIVMRCLEKDRTRRYDGAANLAKDIQRYLTGDAVEACPPTLAYRLTKVYRRNRAAVLIGGAFALLLTLGVVAASLLAIRATTAERMAAADRDVALHSEKVATDQRDAAQSARTDLRQTLYATDLQLAGSLLQEKDRGRTLEVLDRHRPKGDETDLRGFEWHFLNRECRGASRTLALPEGIKRFTPDGRRVYVALRADQRKDGRNGATLRSWDLESGKELPEWEPFPGKDVSFFSISGFNQSGSRAILAYQIGSLQNEPWLHLTYTVLDLESRKLLFTLADRPGTQLHIPLLNRDGRLLAVHYDDEDLRSEPVVTIWNVDEQKVVRTITVDAAKFESFVVGGRAFHPNGQQFAALVDVRPSAESPRSLQLRVWDVKSGADVWRVPTEGKFIPALAYSPDGRFLAESPDDSAIINLRQPDSGQVVHTLRIPDVIVGNTQKLLNFSPDGSRLGVSLTSYPGAYVWEIPTRPTVVDLAPIRSIPTDSTASRVAFSSDNRSVILALSSTTDVSYFDLASRAVTLSGPDAIRSPYKSATLPDRRPVFAGGPYGGDRPATALWKIPSTGLPKAEVRAWDVAGREVFQMQCDSLEDWHSGWTSPDGKRFILIQSSTHPTDPALDRSKVQVWDISTRAEVFTGEIPGGRVKWHGISPDGRTLAISRLRVKRPRKARDNTPGTRLSIWDLYTNREIHGQEIDGRVEGADMSPDGSRVVWALALDKPTYRSEVRAWDTATGKVVWTRDDWDTRSTKGQWVFPYKPEFSNDGRTLVVAASLGMVGEQIHLLDVVTGKDLRPPILNSDGRLTNLCVSPDSRRLIALATRQTSPTSTKSVVVWDIISGRKLLHRPVSDVWSMTMDPEGRRVFLLSVIPGTGKLELETLDGTPLVDLKQP